MSGTHIADGGTSLCACYAMPGTEVVCASRCPVLTQRAYQGRFQAQMATMNYEFTRMRGGGHAHGDASGHQHSASGDGVEKGGEEEEGGGGAVAVFDLADLDDEPEIGGMAKVAPMLSPAGEEGEGEEGEGAGAELDADEDDDDDHHHEDDDDVGIGDGNDGDVVFVVEHDDDGGGDDHHHHGVVDNDDDDGVRVLVLSLFLPCAARY
eukprot:3660899-Rhodomonas_salina.2